ncbi:MAG: FtsQ-type POTRA domain-containing protein [Desulfobulbus sp.]|nr:MAG: FtsQ-type POTRA domain-containing protein [Desulfobulbus sp.]
MYIPQGVKKQRPGRQMLVRLAESFGNCTFFPHRNRKVRRKSAVATQQRSWKLKKLSRGAVCLLLAVAAVATLSGFLVIALARSDVFALSTLTVQGNRMATEGQILEKSGLARGVSLLAVDCGEVESRILDHPWVEQATVKRQWPSTVLIRVRERKPLALVNLERQDRRQLYYMDGKGEIFAPTTPSRDLDFPVLTGEVRTARERNLRVDQDSPAWLAVDFLNLAAQGNQVLPSLGISEVHVDPERGLVVYLIDHPFPIIMGKEKLRTRFNLLVRVLAQLYQKDKVKDVAEIRMDYAEDKILVANH